MALAVSLRRVLLILLSSSILIVFLLYWSQDVIKPQSYISSFEKSIGGYRGDGRANVIPVEKMWTYKCEGDKCVRHHYLNDGNENVPRVPFITCSMTCGNLNIWPHPSISSALSVRSLRFSVERINLKLATEFKAVETQFHNVFQLFLKDLKRIQRLDYSENMDRNMWDEPQIRLTGDADRSNSKRSFTESEIKTGNGNENSKQNSVRDGVGKDCSKCDLDKVLVKVQIEKSPEMHLNFDTDESYKLKLKTDKRQMNIHIIANSFFGARHGLSTLQQLIWFDDEDQLLHILSEGHVKDAPKFRYRGVMLDTSRHYFSVESIKRTIAAMSHSKLNRFHWHITDSQSFPYISKYYPELAAHGAYSDRETYSEEDIREVSEFARLHGVQVIPEIDAPAHAGNGWDWGPKKGLGDLSLCVNQQPWAFFCGEPPCGQLNPKNNNTYLILQRLYEEMLNLTGPTDYFHLGGDEVNLECWNQYFNDTDLRGLWCDFMLNAMNRLKIANKNIEPKYVTVWSSGLTNTKCLSRNQFAVQVWGGSTWQENYDLLDNGFNVIFSHVDAWYLDCGFGNWRSTGEGACSPYRTWQNVYKHRPWERMHLEKAQKKQVLGGEVCLWTEQVDENQLDNRLWPRSAALGERLWSDPDDQHDFDVVPQNVFKRISIFRNRLVELGIKAEPIFPKYCAQNAGECI